MKPPSEHYYLGVQEASSNVCSGKPLPSSLVFSGEGGVVVEEEKIGLNLKETELRLGLPGSDSPERMDCVGVSLRVPKGIVAGAKRGFRAALDGVEEWDLCCRSGMDGGKLFWPVVEEVGSLGRPVEEESGAADRAIAPATKAQVVGWPPIRNYRKNTMATNPLRSKEDSEGRPGMGCLFVKVSMDGAPYLRKVDLKAYCNYKDMSFELGTMFSTFTIGHCGSQGVPTMDGLNESRLVDLLNGSDYVLTYEDRDGDWMLVGDVPWEGSKNKAMFKAAVSPQFYATEWGSAVLGRTATMRIAPSRGEKARETALHFPRPRFAEGARDRASVPAASLSFSSETKRIATFQNPKPPHTQFADLKMAEM